ncbi:hypothetical protein [Shimwellia blattae]|uniref:Uncharacterized protein n=1 Tax=Shimwellia blattae (strain ATCC 29907 / DSM 4481 / JCM 1650 / NBRC 105725 / CDC 9005-74) TaxID=630626 RepID=I2BEN6_SHIBC|nr:hypothetical protein [Shimwellia blattae]AFJ48990.1 hypothetical protein EBL_c39660 [Shimwellia blattae DSM 4481 = NBRC 105725]GAB82314.1 hypothetical protein EB105725_22_00130 [Shimwellia blattae DSM 4481 = NBRC 105725]VDY66475.1 Uncharacterised protein [Shimwellia blattae]VEC28392.1 Uncharacterised protein [Shimwellia blattae]
MPVITLFVSPSLRHRLSPECCQTLITPCRDLCIHMLKADPEHIQIQLLEALVPPAGCPVYVEVRYRQRADRTARVMADFMSGIDRAIRECCAVTARIRCFPQPEDALYARN